MIHSRKKYSYLNSSGMAFELSVTVQEMNQRSIFNKALQLGHIRDFGKEIKKIFCHSCKNIYLCTWKNSEFCLSLLVRNKWNWERNRNEGWWRKSVNRDTQIQHLTQTLCFPTSNEWKVKLFGVNHEGN